MLQAAPGFRVLSPPAVLDVHLLPKVALVLVSLASLLGTALTMSTHGAGWLWVLPRWISFYSVAVATGTSLWWGWFVRHEPESGEAELTARFLDAEARRFRGILRVAGLAALASAPHLLFFLPRVGGDLLATGLFAVAIPLTAHLAASASHPSVPSQGAWKRQPRCVFLCGAALLATQAALDARLTFPALPPAMLLRSAHLLAFGLWLGGAVANLFVAIPAAQAEPTVPVVVCAAKQLERFRRVVRWVLPTLLGTGLLQAYPYLGTHPAGLPHTSAGLLIAAKLGLLLVLVVVFITCPLWRACSPVRGMCNLKDLAARPAPMRTLDNRGKPCAGFVHVMRALQSLGPGEVLELLSTDPLSWWELPAWAQQNGHTLLLRERVGRWRILWPAYRYWIQRGT